MNIACRAPSHPMKRTLVVGGVASYVNSTLRLKLARWGFAVEAHHEVRPTMKAHSPAGIDAVIVFAEMVPGREVVADWVATGKQTGIPVIVLQRKEAGWPQVMERHGIRPLNPVTASAVATTEEESVMKDKPTATAVVPITQSARPAPSPAATPLDAKLDELQVLLAELREGGMKWLTWSEDKGLDYEAVVRLRGHKSI